MIDNVLDSRKQTNSYKDVDFNELLLKAEEGDSEAQNELGNRYDSGIGVPENEKEAEKWWKKDVPQSQKP